MKLLFISLIVLFYSSVYGQEECGTLPRSGFPKRNSNLRLTLENKIDTIPVIFHVLFKTSTENVNDSLILELLKTTLLDLSGTNPDLSSVPNEFQNLIGNPRIHLQLATSLPNGEATSGIIRKKTSIKEFKSSRREAFSESKIFDSKRYLNVYICDVAGRGTGFTPTSGVAAHDGVVIDYKKVHGGSRTLTHEIGHWLNLLHVFEGGCGQGGDGVKDTPKQKKNFSCLTHPVTQCVSHAMFMNFMDYSTCRLFFTLGQVERMKKYIAEFKSF